MTKEQKPLEQLEQESLYIESLIEVQGAIESLSKDEKNPFFKSKYVKLPDVLQMIKPILHYSGFFLTQRLEVEDNRNILLTELRHKSGKMLSSKVYLDIKDKDAGDPQKLGSCITYMRRYSLTALLGIEEIDDDGNNAANSKPNNHLNNLGKIADQEKKEMHNKQNEDNFKGVKASIEACGGEEELKNVWQDKENTKIINSFKKYRPDLFKMIIDSKDMMRQHFLSQEDKEND